MNKTEPEKESTPPPEKEEAMDMDLIVSSFVQDNIELFNEGHFPINRVLSMFVAWMTVNGVKEKVRTMDVKSLGRNLAKLYKVRIELLLGSVSEPGFKFPKLIHIDDKDIVREFLDTAKECSMIYSRHETKVFVDSLLDAFNTYRLKRTNKTGLDWERIAFMKAMVDNGYKVKSNNGRSVYKNMELNKEWMKMLNTVTKK